jgi:hypothetical protein
LIYEKTFTVDHIIPRLHLGAEQLENLVPACRNCNSTKGTKDIEQFRFLRAMQQFHKDKGIWFSSTQVEYLQSIGVNLGIPKFRFWFEDGVL